MKVSTVSNEVDVMAACYKMVLDGFSYPVLQQAGDDIIYGRAGGLSKTFMPSTAELRQYCERVENWMNACVKNAQRLLEAGEVVPVQKRVGGDKMAALMDEIKGISQTRH